MTQSHDDFDIIALNGITGECMTTADQDDWCQRLKEDASEPELTPEQIEEIKAEHEAFLTDLEVAAVKSLARGDWDEIQSCIYFYNPQTKSYDS